MNATNGTTPNAVSIDNLYPAIVQCFVIILCGYLAGRLNYITSTNGKGIATFVSKFCLPALLFQNMCVLDFWHVDWIFLLGILISKSAVFVLVVLLTIVAKRPRNYGYAGLFGIFATQSNDFALGFPILQALYKDSHPEYLKYIYLIAPISVVFLNPIGFTLLEIQKRRNKEVEEAFSTKSKDAKGRSCGGLAIVLEIVKGVFINPIVFMSFIGILGNFIFQQKIPYLLEDILNVLGDAYAASALFYLGISMVGKLQGQMNLAIIVPLLLIGAKGVLLPMVTWMIVGGLERINDGGNATSDAMFGFLYGTFPTAPSVFLYASHYSTAPDIVATAMVAGTFLAAPLMFVSARMLSVVVVSEMDYKRLLLETSFDTSIISMVCCVWVLIIMIFSRRYKRVPHQFLVCLILSHFLSCLGMTIYDNKDCEMKSWRHYIEFTMIICGTLSVRCWTAILAVVLYQIHCRSLCFVLRIKFWLFLIGFGIPAFCTGMLYLLGKHHMHDEIDPSFHYGRDQSIVSVLFLLLCCIITTISLVLKQRNCREYKKIPSTDPDTDDTTINENKMVKKPHVRKVKGKGHGRDQSVSCRVEIHKNMNGDRENNQSECDDCDQGCSGGNIEDIVPFPSETASLISDSSDSSENGITQSMEAQTCQYGTCSREQMRLCAGKLRAYNTVMINVSAGEEGVKISRNRRCPKDEYQTNRFLVLLVFLQLSMFIGLFLCIWRLFNKEITGIYVEIEFLDGVFNYGQGFIILAIFGFDTKYIFLPFLRRWRRLVYGVEEIKVPEKEDLDHDTVHLCDQFIKYHKDNCAKQIVKDQTYHFREYKNVFSGVDMCDWLLEVGLVHDRGEAVTYGRSLIIGQVIAHVTCEHHFHDMPYFYQFTEDNFNDQHEEN